MLQSPGADESLARISPMTLIEINNRQSVLQVDEPRLRRAVSQILAEAGIDRGEVSIAVVADDEMQRLNAKYLDHDWPTDVLSFVIEQDAGLLEGQLIVSAQMAAREAEQFGWRPEDELLLYVIHGALHLVGYDDQTDDALARMRRAEAAHLAHFGLTPRYASA
jgi:probable rRNA maturation factor